MYNTNMGVLATAILLALGLSVVESGKNHKRIYVNYSPQHNNDNKPAHSATYSYSYHNQHPTVLKFDLNNGIKSVDYKKSDEEDFDEAKLEGYEQYKNTKSFNIEGPHQLETIETRSYHKEVPKFDTSNYKVEDHHGKHKEIHYHKHKHMHKHEHKQEHKHEHKQDHKHVHENHHHHKHEHKQEHAHKHHQEHKHAHEHHQKHKHDHHHKNKHDHHHHHGHKHDHHEEHKHGHNHHHKQEHWHESSHGHKHHQEHKHGHHHDHHEKHKHAQKYEVIKKYYYKH